MDDKRREESIETSEHVLKVAHLEAELANLKVEWLTVKLNRLLNKKGG